MKCKNCGANIKREQRRCPYCGSINEMAVKQEQALGSMEKSNQEYMLQVLKESKPMLHYKIHKRVNLVLLGIFICVTLFSMFAFFHQEGGLFTTPGSMEVCASYYEEGKFEELSRYMSEHDMFNPENNYAYSQMVFLWKSYQNCQDYFATSYEVYQETGFYDTSYLELCIREGYEVLTSEVSYLYKEPVKRNQNMYAPYQEKIYMLFTGVLHIPEEMLADVKEGTFDYEVRDALIEYVLEVLPNAE